MKPCPFCAEEIQDAAIKCRYCGESLGVPAQNSTTTSTSEPQASPLVKFLGALLFLGVVAALAACFFV